MLDAAKRRTGPIHRESYPTSTRLAPPGKVIRMPTDPMERSPWQETQTGNDMPPMKRKKALPLNLTREQEVSIVEWLKDHPELFDKSDPSYKDFEKKKALWNAEAEELGQGSGVILLTWYRSMRTRYGKLYKTETKSGAGSSTQLTQRDKWIVENFQFLTPHIYVCPKRKTRRLMQKLASSTSATAQTHEEPVIKQENEDDDEDDDFFAHAMDVTFCATPTTSASGSNPGLSRDNRPPSSHSDSALIDHVASSSAQYIRMQDAGCSTSSSKTNSVPEAYGSFLASFVADVHPRLVSNFMRESWELVMWYKEQGDKLREEESSAPSPAPTVPVSVLPVAVRPVTVANTQRTDRKK